jgi:hypothetical protein
MSKKQGLVINSNQLAKRDNKFKWERTVKRELDEFMKK